MTTAHRPTFDPVRIRLPRYETANISANFGIRLEAKRPCVAQPTTSDSYQLTPSSNTEKLDKVAMPTTSLRATSLPSFLPPRQPTSRRRTVAFWPLRMTQMRIWRRHQCEERRDRYRGSLQMAMKKEKRI